MAISKLILNGEVQMDVTSNTNTSNNMLNGVVGTKNDGTSVTGNIASKSSTDLTISGATVTAPAGYYANAASKTVATATHPNPSASIASATGVVTASHTQGTGYVTGGTTTGTLNLTTQAATTYYPSTADQTISSYRWLTGAQTIKSVTTSNLTAENIAEGVVVQVGDSSNASRITQVTGTHSGGGGHDAVLLNNGIYNATVPIYKNIKYNNINYYINGQTFNFNEGDTISTTMYGIGSGRNVYLNNTLIGNGTAVSFSAPSYPLTVYFSDDDGIYFNKAYPSGTLNITSNGIYSVYGYSSASVSVAASGYTADQIAMYTISGNISGDATEIKGYAFYNCSYLTAASFPTCSSIGSYAFYFASRLTTVSFPSCTTIGSHAFEYCGSLTSVTFPMCSIINSCAFSYCEGLTTVSFPSCKSIGYSAFYYCSVLSTISFPSCTNISDGAFMYCRSLTSVNFPSCIDVGLSAFYGCYNLSIISFPVCKNIQGNAFPGTKITEANFPNVSKIAYYAFSGCSSLITANFPSCTTIQSNAFAGCSVLSTISFPLCASISSYAFQSCYNLLSVYLLGSSVPKLANANAFYRTPISDYTTSTGGVYGSIFVPSSLYNSYLTATNWSLYSDRIVSV